MVLRERFFFDCVCLGDPAQPEAPSPSSPSLFSPPSSYACPCGADRRCYEMRLLRGEACRDPAEVESCSIKPKHSVNRCDVAAWPAADGFGLG